MPTRTLRGAARARPARRLVALHGVQLVLEVLERVAQPQEALGDQGGQPARRTRTRSTS